MMDCPRCESKRLERVRPEFVQNKRLRCLDCRLEWHPNEYESTYELFHRALGVCGRCKQKLPERREDGDLS